MSNEVTSPEVSVDSNVVAQAQAIADQIQAATVKVTKRGRPANAENISMVCTDCGKKVTYRACEADKIGFEKRVQKSGKSREDFISTFKCRACTRKIREQAAAVVAQMQGQTAPATTTTTDNPAPKKKAGRKPKNTQAATVDIPVASDTAVEQAAASLDAAIAAVVNG